MLENSGILEQSEDVDEQVVSSILKGVDSIKVFEVKDAQRTMQYVGSVLKPITAAGGVVLNENDELLMIHRRGFWDLPKGKAEAGETITETAIREVEEECGIQGLSIVSDPFSTYHVYEEKGQTILKESIWFRMATTEQSLTPQTEEDIEQAEWVQLPISNEKVSSAYPSIREVLLHFSLVD